MRPFPLIVSYYTENTPYEKEAEDLISSCKKFNLNYYVAPIKNLGSWSRNCCYKPRFLLECLAKHNGPVVWTDIDSIFVKNPDFFYNCNADIALRIDQNLPQDAKGKVLSGTLFFNNTHSAKKLLQLWEKSCETRFLKPGMVFDQVELKNVLFHYATLVEFEWLPSTYITIVDESNEAKSAQEDAVILHYQASRLYQKIIDQELSPALVDPLSAATLKKIRTESSGPF